MSKVNKLVEFVKGITSGSVLMQGREKIDTDAVIGVELTMRDFEMLTGEDGEFPVIIFDELPNAYYFGGKILSEICKGIDANGMHEMLTADGLRIMLGRKINKSHKPYTTVTVLD